MKITIDKQYMLHEGGTKFYQVLRVQVQDKSPLGRPVTRGTVTVTHWGSQIGEPKQLRIVSNGQRKIVSGDTYTAAIKAKKSRSYHDEIAWGSTNVLESETKLRVYLTEELGAVDAGDVIAKLGLDPTAKFDPTADPDDTGARKAAGAAKPAEVRAAAAEMEGWGDF